MSDFNSPCNEAEIQFLEQLAREHPKDIKVTSDKTPGAPKLKIDFQSESVKNYVVWMLDQFRQRRSGLEEIYNIQDWEYES
jgi:hypothetical protein